MSKHKRKKPQSAIKGKAAPQRKSRPWVSVVVCYVLAVLLYVGGCTLSIVQDGLRVQNSGVVQQRLTLADFVPVGMVQREDDAEGRQTIISTDDDPQLWYGNGNGFYMTRLVFDAQSDRPSGEIVLYYATQLDEDGEPILSEDQKLWAQQDAEGRWVFDLSGVEVYALRLDPGTKGGIYWTIDEILLNAPRPVTSYYVPSAQPLVLMALLPGLAAVLWNQGRRLWRERPRANG